MPIHLVQFLVYTGTDPNMQMLEQAFNLGYSIAVTCGLAHVGFVLAITLLSRS